jgi:hypothetical protein
MSINSSYVSSPHSAIFASSFNLYHTFFSLTLFSSCLRLLSHLPVTSIHPSLFPSITQCRMQFLRKILPTQLAFLLFTVCRAFFCLLYAGHSSVCRMRGILLFTVCREFFCLLYAGHSSPLWLYAIRLHFSHDWCNWSFTSFSSITFQKFPVFIWYTLQSVQVSSAYKDVFQMYHFTSFLRKFKSNLLERNYFNSVLRTCQQAGCFPDVYHPAHDLCGWLITLSWFYQKSFINLVPQNSGRVMSAENCLDHHGRYKLRRNAFHAVRHDGSLHFPYYMLDIRSPVVITWTHVL